MVLGGPSGTGDPDCYPNLDFGGENCPRSPDNGISEAFERRDSEGDNCGSNPIPWYGGEAEPELPDVSGCDETTASITAIVVEWGRGHNFKPVRYGGSVGRVRFVCGCGGRMAGPRKVNPETAPSNTRRNVTKYALPGQARCPFRLNYRWTKYNYDVTKYKGGLAIRASIARAVARRDAACRVAISGPFYWVPLWRASTSEWLTSCGSEQLNPWRRQKGFTHLMVAQERRALLLATPVSCTSTRHGIQVMTRIPASRQLVRSGSMGTCWELLRNSSTQLWRVVIRPKSLPPLRA